MSDWNGFKGAAKRLDDVDIPRIGHEIGVGEDEIHAFMDVEASGGGFDGAGRPKMLFEPHVFYRNLSGAKRDAAVKAGLAYKSWGTKPYPKDSYPRLVEAMAIDETAALKAASWGLGQILGENHAMVGYDTVQDMVQAFMEDEEHHLKAIVDFIKAAGIDDDLRRHDWTAVARVYNGAKYAKHNYHGRMAAAFARWQKIRDTPWSPDADDVEVTATGGVLGPAHGSAAGGGAEPATAARMLEAPQIKSIQQRLRDLGYFEVGRVDGSFGNRTRDALNSFRQDNGLPVSLVTGSIDDATAAALVTAAPRAIAPERANAGEEAVADHAAVADAKKAGVVGGLVAVGGGVGSLVDVGKVTELVGVGGQIKALVGDIGILWPILLIAGGVAIYFWTRKIRREEVESYRMGETP